jgi:acyl-coenzyme A thioesterase PaaI-like protein
MSASRASVSHRTFSEMTAVEADGPGRFVVQLDPEWTIADKPNGGYLLAMMGRASTRDAEHDHVIAASAHFLRSPSPGPGLIEVVTLRRGRSASQARVSMTQGGVDCIEAIFTSGHLDRTDRPRWSRWLPEDAPLPIDRCERLAPMLPDGRPAAILGQVELRLEPDSLGFARGDPTGRAELRGWLSLPRGESFDPTALLYAVDGLPPATFDVEYSGWVPTIELTAYVRARPVPGPVRIVQRAQLVDAGRVDEVCLVWDSSGRLVAQGTQLAGVRFP